MSNFVQFEATTPVITEATEAVVYDKYWMASFRIKAEDPTKPVILIATFAPARDVTVDDGEGGTITYKEIQKGVQPKRLVVQDLFGEAAADPEGLGTIMNGVLTYLNNRATSEGIL